MKIEDLDLTKVRELFKSLRISRKLHQKDLAEEGISAGTISNFELGRKHVNEEKVYRLFGKLGVKKRDLPRLIKEKQKKEIDVLTILKLDLKTIETEMDCGDYHKANRTLKKLKLPIDHPYTAITNYLKGKYYYKMQNWSKSHINFVKSIQIVENYLEIKSSNIKAASFYELARIAYRQNNLDNALLCVENGLDAFELDGEREHFKYHLLLSKAIYLERLDQISEAMTILEEMWTHLDEIDTEIQLNMYDLQAKLYNKQQMYEKAIRYTSKGIEIARRVESYDRLFELWTTLGTSYNHIGEFNLAMKCFQTAAHLEGKVQRKFLSATNHFQLGLLYLEEENIEQAEEELQKAMKISKEENDLLKHCESQFGYARCKLKQNLQKEAIDHFKEALQRAEKHSFRTQQREIALELTKFYEDKDPDKHYKYMTIFYQNSLSLNGGDQKMITKELQSQTTGRIFEADPPNG